MSTAQIIVPISGPRPLSTVPDTVAGTKSILVSTSPEKVHRKPSAKLSVPLDGPSVSRGYVASTETRKLVRRDSLERREALLKGKEGSRQRRRWENDRLMSNPWAQPPLPSDWQVGPTYPTRSVPYYLAPLWDAAEFQRAVEAKLHGRKNSTTRTKRKGQVGMSPMEEAAANIPKEVRARLKRARAAKGLLQDLEEDVRSFVKKWNERETRLRDDGLHDIPVVDDTEEDEEIVFVGRNGVMHDSLDREQREKDAGWDSNTKTEKMVFEGVDGDKGAAFARWLVHSLGSYYGLKTWSVTVEAEGEVKREAYVGVDSRARGWKRRGTEFGREIELPRPLWGMV